jgi:hypothetical protein
MRLTLRVSKIGHGWRWFYEDFDVRYPDRILETSPDEYATWQAAEAAATTAHPEVTEIFRMVVGGHGTAYEDSL